MSSFKAIKFDCRTNSCNLHYERFPDGTVKCIEDEIPFELPNGWAWSRLEPVATVITDYVANGSFASLKENVRTYKEKNYALFVRTVDFAKNFTSDLSYIDEESYNFLEKSKLYGGELMLSNIGASIGKVFKVPKLDMPMSLAPNSIILRFIDEITTDYFEYVFKSFVGQDYLQFLSGGAAMPKFNKTDLRAMIVPIAPLQEQYKIVNTIKDITTYIDELDDSFSDLSSIIQSVKSKILDLAIRGKLVPQNSDDEPASVLLERIRAEKEELIKQGKIKRDKKESIIFKGEDNSYYDAIIPQSWEITNLSDVTLNISDGSHNPPPKKNKGVPLLSATNIYDNKINYTSATRWITEDEWIIENARTKIEVGDVLITIVGTIGRTAVVSDATRFALQRSVAVIKPNMIDSKYLMYVLQAPMIIDWLNTNAKGNAQVGIYLKDLARLSFPLPPLAEQKRIVEAIEIAFAQLDEILNSIS